MLWSPAGKAIPQMAAVLCHPHPLFGGTMHNKVIYQAAKSLDALGLAVLRFNFRGAGLSAGVHDRGLGERDDVRSAVDFLAGEFPGVPLLLAGFSFGSCVGLRIACEDARVQDLIGLGIPVNNCDFSYLMNCPKPKLFVHGATDEHGALEKVEKMIPAIPGANRLVVVPEADHFFTGRLDQLDRAITVWMTERHPHLGAS
jgi:alpha/beta superfamily hydrolase